MFGKKHIPQKITKKVIILLKEIPVREVKMSDNNRQVKMNEVLKIIRRN